MEPEDTVLGLGVEEENLFVLSGGELFGFFIQWVTATLSNDWVPVFFVGNSDKNFGLVQELFDFLVFRKQVTDLETLYGEVFPFINPI